jgi:hypothetical protein
MAALCNDTARCGVMNLGWASGGHCPYLVRQEGHVAGGTDFRPQRFILQKDGRWLLNLAFVMLPEAEQEAQLFHSLGELSGFIDRLGVKPVIADATLPEGADPEEILRHFESCTNGILRGMRKHDAGG